MSERIKCDMCGSAINDGKCDCGNWQNAEETKDNPIAKALKMFHEMEQFVVTGDAPQIGCAIVMFRGDYNDCQKVKEFIYAMKKRPHYE